MFILEEKQEKYFIFYKSILYNNHELLKTRKDIIQTQKIVKYTKNNKLNKNDNDEYIFLLVYCEWIKSEC